MDTQPVAGSRDSALQKCDELFTHFDKRARRYKRSFTRYSYSSVALTVGVTVISALQAIYRPSLSWQWILPVASGLAAFATTMVHATNAQELWLRARSMTQKLATERFLFLQSAGSYTGDDTSNLQLFSKRLMEVWAGGHAEWEHAIESQKGASI
jgi:Protein of unknown function (DUF4231)